MNILIISQSHHHSLCRLINRNIKPNNEEIEVNVISDPLLFNDEYDKSAVDIVITDIVMSGKNGLDIITETKSSHPKISILAIADTIGINGMFQYMPIAKMLGADEVLEKPVNSKHFVDTVSALIEMKASQMAA